MITSDALKQVEQKYIALGFLKYRDNIIVPDSLEEFILKIVCEYNPKLYTQDLRGGTVESPGKHRSTMDIFRLVKNYKPEATLDEVMDILWNFNWEQKIKVLLCSTINKMTYFPWSSNRYYDVGLHSKRTDEGLFYKDTSNGFTYKDHYDYFDPDLVKQRKEERKLMRKAIAPLKGGFRMRIRSRHPSHNVLRIGVPKLGFRSLLRLGSTTEVENDNAHIVEINSVEGIRNSSDKKRMKDCFMQAEVRTAEWYIINGQGQFIKKAANENGDKVISKDQLPYPIIAKHRRGSRGSGNYKLDTRAKLDAFLVGKNVADYIFEKFYSYSREYRAHVTADGCFYTCRKMLKDGVAADKKWQRHDDNCVWIREENPQFDKPVNWATIIKDCVRALEALGLDIGAFDIKVQGTNDDKGRKRQDPAYILIESCSAPSFGEVTSQKYIEILPILATKLAKEYHII